MLIPARTETDYWHEYIFGRAEIRFLHGRLKFLYDDGTEASVNAPFPSAVIVFGAGSNKIGTLERGSNDKTLHRLQAEGMPSSVLSLSGLVEGNEEEETE